MVEVDAYVERAKGGQGAYDTCWLGGDRSIGGDKVDFAEEGRK